MKFCMAKILIWNVCGAAVCKIIILEVDVLVISNTFLPCNYHIFC